VREVEPPEPAPGQVRVRLAGGGICASELPVWEGREWFEYPLRAGAPGHEGWGYVEAIGEGVADVSPGDRVGLISEHAHAEFDLADAAHVVRLPSEIAPDRPFPAEPLACAVNAMRRADVKPGDRVAIIGCGFLGLLLVQLCAAVASEVAAVSRRRSSLEMAGDLGATSCWRARDGALERQQPFDVVFEVTGKQQPLDLASRLTTVRGRLVIVGYHQDGQRVVDMQLWNWRGLDVINAHERDPAAYVRGMNEAVQAVLDGRLDPAPLLTHSFALDELGQAYRISIERPNGFIKAVWRSE
jgi:threonine dehydrogenase-like Zn-dependent dehydrogenase